MSFSKLALLTSLLFGGAVGQPTDCTEIITLTNMEFTGTGVPDSCNFFDFECELYEGDYYFSGFDSDGYPTYTQPETGAYFYVYVTATNNPVYGVLASIAWTNGTADFAPTWDHFADIVVTTTCTDIPTFVAESGTLEGANDKFYFPVTGSNTLFPPIYITATLDDCLGVGIDNPQPTPAPVDPPANGCPNYDDTVYGDCSGDVNCANCQPWGCASCATGYYKMGNLMRCQSCTDNYPNCAQCGDWNGCTSCNGPYTLQYSGDCSDEICQ